MAACAVGSPSPLSCSVFVCVPSASVSPLPLRTPTRRLGLRLRIDYTAYLLSYFYGGWGIS
eukprot:1751086-Prymnesium_polylepis.1